MISFATDPSPVRAATWRPQRVVTRAGRQPLLVSTGASPSAVDPGEQAMGLQVAQDEAF